MREGSFELFGKAIYALARISDEFWFDPVERGLSLRSVNSSRSAYACIFFSSTFFQHYSCTNPPELGRNKKNMQPRCKLIVKAVLPVFRCLNTVERNVEKCKIYTNFHNCRVVFQLFCKHGVMKTHNLTFQECEALEVVFGKHLCPNILKIQSRQLADILIHFPAYQEEITLAVTPLKVWFKTYLDNEADFGKATHTEIHLSPEEFEYFQIGIDSEVTFCLKELRGLLAYAEAISAPVSVHFDISGRPIAFGIEDLLVEARFVLATLTETEHGTSSQEPLRLSQAEKRSRPTESCHQDSVISNQDPKTAPTPENTLTTTEELVPPDPSHNKFHTLFFGAVSSRDQDITHVFHSLATASDTEEDFGNGELSPAF
ncbi:hypothetical protein JRQ81_007879 [Phrynocephalus forsythii]|uniref:Cell cycle checkpoint control protein RAD9A n=1 Tax=Phrynocephalus forsythii TaxID=171643 RepID=A0A9Q0XED4_9SAUR|nr:hypothetical protein JRQ81_007879 [Phrynocephalus forsythii]